MLLLYFLNNKGLFEIAKNGTLIILNAGIFIAFTFEPALGVQYFYFPMFLLSLTLHGPKDSIKALLFALIPIFLFIISMYKQVGIPTTLANNDVTFIIINFVTATLVSGIALIYLIKSNLKSEKLLVKANSETIKASDELRINNEILAKTNNELDKFMYSSSHDLRAPLASILGLANLARLEPIEKHADYIEMIRDRVIGLDFFIKDIIDFSKNSHTDIRYEIIDVQELVELCVDHNKYLPGAEHIKLVLDLKIPKIKSDMYRLSSILTTLIANAVKYHNLEQEKPILSIEVSGDNPISFTVRDNGQGFDKHIKAKIFDMFYRGNELSTGSGLGLYIAREMLNSLRGTFEVNSVEGEGSSFTFYLPNPS
jgi:signal transduction histidine kinase